MSIWNKLFGQSESKFTHFENKLSAHEQIAANKLHTTHPNVRNIQTKNDIDLKNVRKHGTKIAAAGAVLGMFLAIPHLFGHPANTNQPTPPPQGGEVTKQIPQPTLTQVQPPAPSNPSSNTVSGGQQLQQPKSGINTPTQAPTAQPNQPPSNVPSRVLYPNEREDDHDERDEKEFDEEKHENDKHDEKEKEGNV